jgi:Ribbon-helix-helix protein, copG family
VAKRKKTVYLDEDVLREARIQAARTGRNDSEVIEAALRSYLGLDVLEEVWARSDLDEEDALSLAYEALDASRRGG